MLCRIYQNKILNLTKMVSIELRKSTIHFHTNQHSWSFIGIIGGGSSHIETISFPSEDEALHEYRTIHRVLNQYYDKNRHNQ